MVPQKLGELFRTQLFSSTVEQHQNMPYGARLASGQPQQGGLVDQRDTFAVRITRQALQVLISQRLYCRVFGLAYPCDLDLHVARVPEARTTRTSNSRRSALA